MMTDSRNPEVTVERIRAQAVKWAEHHRKAESDAEDEIARNEVGDYSIEREHRAVAEAFEDIVKFIDHPPPERLAQAVRNFKRAHGGRSHGR